MNNPLKSITIEGNLFNQELNFKICQDYFQLQNGIWEIAISSISISLIEELKKDYIIQISCNCVQGHKISKGQLKKYHVELQQFKISKDLKKNVVNFNPPIWYIVNNSIGDYFTIYFKEWPMPVEKKITKNILVAANVLFRRIK